MQDQVFEGNELAQWIAQVPGGKPRIDALQIAIQKADEAQEHFWRLMFRYRYGCEVTFRDDPPKAIPVAAEFMAIFEEHADIMSDYSADTVAEMHLMAIQMGIDPIVFLPQIPFEQWQQMMDDFYHWIKHYHIGLRTYWWQMARFWQYIDQKKAYEYFEKFWKTGRDGLSDCRACERSYAVQMALMIGDREAADEYAKPMEQGRIQFCSDTPQLYWLAYLENALNHGDLKEAEKRANALYRKADRDKSDLSYLGAIIRCWTYTDRERALELVSKRLEWTIGMWDQKKVYDFYKGAWVCFQEVAKNTEQVTLVLPKQFSLYQESGIYRSAELADWFYTHAQKIAKAFDQRNNSKFFGEDLNQACMDSI